MDISTSPELFVVDDDANVRDVLTAVLRHEGYKVSGFAEGGAFLAAARVRTPSCIVLDVQMPGRSGLDILKELDAHHYDAPILIMSGQGDIPMAVDAIKRGAFDFIEKPFVVEAVIVRVREAIAGWKRPPTNGHAAAGRAHRFHGHELLTPREREVLGQIAGGASNKEAGRRLGISPRTIEVHRARIMEKLKARNAADLVRIVLSDDEARLHQP